MDLPLEYEEIASIGIGMFKRLNGNCRYPALLAVSGAAGTSLFDSVDYGLCLILTKPGKGG